MTEEGENSKIMNTSILNSTFAADMDEPVNINANHYKHVSIEAMKNNKPVKIKGGKTKRKTTEPNYSPIVSPKLDANELFDSV